MILKSSNQVSGFSGFNRFMGSFVAKGNQLTFGQMAATKMMCAKTMKQEQNFLKALENSKLYTIEKESLKVYNTEQIELLRFDTVYLK